jgi:hypothetical protein
MLVRGRSKHERDENPLRRTFLLMAGAALAPPLMAQERFPSKMIRIVVPFAAGGVGDALARLMSRTWRPASALRSSSKIRPVEMAPRHRVRCACCPGWPHHPAAHIGADRLTWHCATSCPTTCCATSRRLPEQWSRRSFLWFPVRTRPFSGGACRLFANEEGQPCIRVRRNRVHRTPLGRTVQKGHRLASRSRALQRDRRDDPGPDRRSTALHIPFAARRCAAGVRWTHACAGSHDGETHSSAPQCAHDGGAGLSRTRAIAELGLPGSRVVRQTPLCGSCRRPWPPPWGRLPLRSDCISWASSRISAAPQNMARPSDPN